MHQDVRLNAVRAIISAGRAAQSSMKDVRRRMRHTHPDVQRAAVQALRGIAHVCPKVAKAAARDLEENDGDVVDRKRAIWVLGGAGKNVLPYLPIVATALEERDWGIRRA